MKYIIVLRLEFISRICTMNLRRNIIYTLQDDPGDEVDIIMINLRNFYRDFTAFKHLRNFLPPLPRGGLFFIFLCIRKNVLRFTEQNA